MSKTYREFDGRHPLLQFALDGNATINTAWRTSKQAMRTVHKDRDILHKTIYEFQCLCRSCLNLLSRQPVQPLQHRFHIIFAKEFLPEFLWIVMCYKASGQKGRRSLRRPCLACCIAEEMVESSSIKIFTMISVIEVVNGILI
jgi:hypothetical protein